LRIKSLLGSRNCSSGTEAQEIAAQEFCSSSIQTRSREFTKIPRLKDSKNRRLCHRVVNLSQNTVQIKKSQTHSSCRNFWNDQSVHSIFDYPKMPRFWKKQV